MTNTDDNLYDFDGFTLNPRERLLLYFNKRINLADKDLDILTYMVQNSNVLITNKALLNAVWGEEIKIHHGNISNHIAKIRKALNCNPRHPRFIETSHNKGGYRFKAKVTQTQTPIDNSFTYEQKSRELEIESHLIAPVFLGQGAYDKIRGPDKETTWAKYKEFKIDNGRLCVFPTGIGVWHLTGKHQFSSFTDVALWRRKTYERILKGKHTVEIYNRELKVPLISRSTNIFGSILGRIGYVFSVLVLHEPTWARDGKLRRPLQLLSHLSPLENFDATNKSADAVNLERKILDGTYLNFDTKEFGSPGQDLGFANWDGLSYIEHGDGSSTLGDDTIEFEIAVQSTWWFAKCLYDICLANGPRVKEDLTPAIQDLKWHYAKLQGLVATESTARRTMIEAILTTSRLHRLVDDTIKLYAQL